MVGMPRFRTHAAKPNQQGRPATLLASAVLVRQSQIRAIPEEREWQLRAWEFFDSVGELRFASQWISNALSRCTLHVGVMSDDSRAEPVGLDQYPDADPRARVPLAELFGGPTGHGEMLARLATHLTVPGESYVLGYDSTDPDYVGRRWQVCCKDELTTTRAGVLKVRQPETDKFAEVQLSQATVIRMWRPHPRRAWEADSPVRAALPVLKELLDLSAHINATIESRLAGAGILLVPEEAVIPAPINGQGDQPLHEDPAMATIIDAMVTPISNRDSAAAVVPILIRMPAGANGKMQYLTFSTPLDEKVQDLREASIRRFATVVDIPAEVLTGTAQANRWNAWKISEDAIKIHLEPLLELICDAFTTQYLWPALRAMGVRDVERHVIYGDTSDLVLRPNRGPESQNLFEHTLVSGSVVRRANGFTDADAPSEEEQHRVLLMQLAQKGINPFLAQPYLKLLGIELDLPAVPPPLRPQQIEDISTGYLPPGDAPLPGTRVTGRPPTPKKINTRPDPTPGNPDKLPPTVSSDVSASAVAWPRDGSLALVEMGALRALELVGKRLLNNGNRAWRGQLRDVDAWDIHTHIPAGDVDDVLDGAYTLLRHVLPDAADVHDAVDAYVRERLVTRQAHDRDRLAAALVAAGCLGFGGHRAIA
jgi:hypothetical protein